MLGAAAAIVVATVLVVDSVAAAADVGDGRSLTVTVAAGGDNLIALGGVLALTSNAPIGSLIICLVVGGGVVVVATDEYDDFIAVSTVLTVFVTAMEAASSLWGSGTCWWC